MSGHITPSKPDYWRGTRVEGATFTAEQTEALKKFGSKIDSNRRRYQLPSVFPVNMTPSPNFRQPRPAPVIHECPVVSCTKDRTRLCIIAPNGFETWVAWK
jgi:hypothetical protein